MDELSVDELARRAGLPTRTIREYQTMGLLPSPERRGRVGIYRVAHLQRLQLIGRLQDRGYSLAGIRDLLTSWTDGDELTDILGLSPDELVHLDEPGAPATLDQLDPPPPPARPRPARRPPRRRRHRPLRTRPLLRPQPLAPAAHRRRPRRRLHARPPSCRC